MADVVLFPGGRVDDVAVVGGKAASLLRLDAAGLPVPPGGVLTTGFFAPWFAAVLDDPAWQAVVGAGPEGWAAACPAVQALGPPLSGTQEAALATLREAMGGALMAVRSSSPEEDLASASFAGGYATRLGVTADGLEAAVRACFASALDERVLRYKHEHGFDPLAPRIAVVVQKQLDAEVAGVAFSLDPISNDYDLAAIDACWGLGETVVAGLATPDHVVVDKVDGARVETVVGAKQRSLWLRAEGGTEERAGHRTDELCLSDARIAELVATVTRIEALFARPVDVEWAWADGALHLLQARPITAYLPLPPQLVTAPGDRRRLYMDASLSNGLTLSTPVSPLSLDWLSEIFTRLLEHFVGPLGRDAPPERAVYFTAGGRLYANLSQMLWIQSPERLGKSQQSVDRLMARIVRTIDRERYRSERRPGWLGLRSLLRLPRLVWRALPLTARLLGNLIAPERGFRRYEAAIAATEARLRGLRTEGRPFEEVLTDGFETLFDGAFTRIWAALGSFGIGLAVVDALASQVDRELALKVQRGFAGNVVVEMGVALARMASRLGPDGTLPPELEADWAAFHDRFGSRGPVEMDLASPRYADDPELAITQMKAMARGGVDPGERHARLLVEREAAWAELMRRSGWLRRALLRRPYRLLDRFAGTRDTPKYLLVLYNHALRKVALAEGAALVSAGRLDAAEHVFDLRMGQLAAARADAELDLRALRAENTAFVDSLPGGVTFPPVIDSRGRILRPPEQETPGELRGMGVSPGVARGPVRTLSRADPRGIQPGDVLVAYTTDPGWTPLFVNAAAVVLEIGGTLQHGAVVAREYGKPCVVGISRVLERLEDGEIVEVDGVAGVVRRAGAAGQGLPRERGNASAGRRDLARGPTRPRSGRP